MKINSLPNLNWGIEITECNLSEASATEIQCIGKLLMNEYVVLIREQNLTPVEEVEICRKFGSINKIDAINRCPLDESGKPIQEIQRVTGQRHPDGTPMGLFGHDHDLDWHANRASAENEREPLIWLYAIHNVEGTRTSWANCTLAYQNLDVEFQCELDSLYGIFGFEPNTYTTWNEWKTHRNDQGIKIVRDVLGNGQKSLFFPFLQLFGFKDKSEEYSRHVTTRMKQQILKPEYVYHHDWREGDVLMSDQWNTIHKRWACDVSNRLLHRIAFGWEHVLIDGLKRGELVEANIPR